MKSRKPTGFSRREKEMMDVIYRLGQATVAEVREQMTHPPSYSSVRGTLSGLERKGHLPADASARQGTAIRPDRDPAICGFLFPVSGVGASSSHRRDSASCSLRAARKPLAEAPASGRS